MTSLSPRVCLCVGETEAHPSVIQRGRCKAGANGETTKTKCVSTKEANSNIGTCYLCPVDFLPCLTCL